MSGQHLDSPPSGPTPEAHPVHGTGAPELSILIVTWNCREHVRACLRALAASDAFARCEVVVVDNASTDGTPDVVAHEFRGARLVRNAGNRGFAGANNQAMALARGEAFLLLNPDCFLDRPDTLGRLLDALASRPDVAAFGPRLLFPDGRHQVGDAGFRPSPATVLSYALGLSRFGRLPGLFVSRPDRLRGAETEVDWVCGACLLVRRDAVELAGGLDERFFMYGEDVEFGCRLRAHGLRVAYLRDVAATHVGGGSQPGRAVPTRWLDSLATLYWRLNGGRLFPAFKLVLAAGFLARAAGYGLVLSLRGRGEALPKARLMLGFARHVLRIARPAGAAP